MNRGKEGRPYGLSNTYIQFLTTIRHPYLMPYHQLEGFTCGLNRLMLYLPSGDHSSFLKQSLSLDPDPYQNLRDT
jgi:hypothetical protein